MTAKITKRKLYKKRNLLFVENLFVSQAAWMEKSHDRFYFFFVKWRHPFFYSKTAQLSKWSVAIILLMGNTMTISFQSQTIHAASKCCHERPHSCAIADSAARLGWTAECFRNVVHNHHKHAGFWSILFRTLNLITSSPCLQVRQEGDWLLPVSLGCHAFLMQCQQRLMTRQKGHRYDLQNTGTDAEPGTTNTSSSPTSSVHKHTHTHMRYDTECLPEQNEYGTWCVCVMHEVLKSWQRHLCRKPYCIPLLINWWSIFLHRPNTEANDHSVESKFCFSGQQGGEVMWGVGQRNASQCLPGLQSSGW